MNYNPFKIAKPVWPKEHLNTKNVCVFFLTDLDKDKEYTLRITGSSLYRVFLGNDLILYGPSRSAQGYFRVDEFNFKTNADTSLKVEVSGYNIDTFYVPLHYPFIQIEVLNKNNEVIKSTPTDFRAILNNNRYIKCARFSYQRAFQESYHFDEPLNDNVLELIELGDDIIYQKKNLPYLTYPYINYNLVEKGTSKVDDNIEFIMDRCLEKANILKYDYNDLEIKPFLIINNLIYNKYKELDNYLTKNEYLVYKYKHSKTGFIYLDVCAKVDSELIIYFDEVDQREIENDSPIDINYRRNDTFNLIYYKLKKGKLTHLSFEAYTAKYIKVLCLDGIIEVNDIGLRLYENSETDKLKFNTSDEKLNLVIDAARNTLAQNSVDILTDCPSRERAGWLCDSKFSSIGEKIFTGSNKVERNLLESYALFDNRKNLPKGAIPMCYPSDQLENTFIPNWMMFYVIEVYESYIRNNDNELKELSKERVVGIIDYFKNFENEYELLENLESWVFVEWSKANDFLSGVNYPTNMLYAKMLECYSYLYGDKTFLEKSNRIRKNIIELSYNGEFFIDNSMRVNNKLKRTNNISETCQYYAFYFNTVNEVEYKDLFTKLVEYFGPNRKPNVYPNVHRSNAFIGNVLRFELLLKNGFYDKFLTETKEYYYNMAILTHTLWEHSSKSNSLNHGFQSFGAVMIIMSITGFVRVDELNKIIYFKEIKPSLIFDIKIPLNDEYIDLKYDGKTYNITIPKGYERRFL